MNNRCDHLQVWCNWVGSRCCSQMRKCFAVTFYAFLLIAQPTSAQSQTIGDSSVHATPLFTRAELEAAFRLILNPAEAETLADNWFRLVTSAGQVDANGFFVPDELEPDDGAPSVLFAPSERPQTDTSYAVLERMTDNQLREWLSGFSDFHLNLVALVSAEADLRVRRLRGESEEQAQNRRTQTLHMVAALRRR